MSKARVFLSILLTILLLASLATGYYFFDRYQKTKALLENPEEAAKVETQTLINKVGKLMELPQGEPTIATVLDKDKLADQPFFENAQNGDKVIIYAEDQLAVLYRPSTNKIVGFAPVSIGNPQVTEETSDQETPSPKPLPATTASPNPEI